MFSTQVTVLVAISLWCVLSCVYCQDSAMDDFFMKASKSIPRIGRSNSKSSKGSNDDFENFFLKASKSVPRIGRRDQLDHDYEDEESSVGRSRHGGRPRIEYSDKFPSGNIMMFAGLPVSELAKNNPTLTDEEYDHAIEILEQSASKEMDRKRRSIE